MEGPWVAPRPITEVVDVILPSGLEEEFIRMNIALRAMTASFDNSWLGEWPKEDLPPNPLYMELFE